MTRPAWCALLSGTVLLLGLAIPADPAAAQWSSVPGVPAVTLFSLRVTGDTLVAGADTTVYLSTDGGANWSHSSKPAAGVGLIEAVLVRNQQLFVGTAGQGVFLSGDLGGTWQPFSQGLVGGAFDSQLDVSDLEVRGDSLYAATLGAGVYVRNLAASDTWHHYGEQFEPNQASNVNDLELGGARLLACAGGNGSAFYRDPGDADWTISFFGNGGLLPGISAQTAIWTGSRWVVGTSSGVFHSPEGHEPWTASSSGPTSVEWTTFAPSGQSLFAAFSFFTGAVFASSPDDGSNWAPVDILPGKFIYRLAEHGGRLYAAQLDGLWARTAPTAAVTGRDLPEDLAFALAGPQPVRDAIRFRFQLPEPGEASIEVFDVLGRVAAPRIRGSWSAGPHEVGFDARALPAGVYAARLTAGERSAVLRVVRIR